MTPFFCSVGLIGEGVKRMEGKEKEKEAKKERKCRVREMSDSI
jgi:hypothetical protein